MAEVLLVPEAERVRVLGAEEHAADAENFLWS
jgi:hypothetical protein